MLFKTKITVHVRKRLQRGIQRVKIFKAPKTIKPILVSTTMSHNHKVTQTSTSCLTPKFQSEPTKGPLNAHCHKETKTKSRK